MNKTFTMNDIILFSKEISFDMIDKFSTDLLITAEENWGNMAQKDLKRLITSVLMSKPYDQVTDEDIVACIQKKEGDQ